MKTIRTFPALLACALLPLGAAAVRPAAAQPVPDTTTIPMAWRIEPAAPCFADSVFLVVQAYVSTPCDSFMGVEALNPRFVRIQRHVYVDRAGMCPASPPTLYAVPVALGRFPAGPQAGILEVETVLIRNDGSATRDVQRSPFDFTVSANCAIPPPGPPPGLPFVTSITTVPTQPCTGHATSLVLSGVFTNGCGRVVDARVDDPGHVEITLKPEVLADTVCTEALRPWRQAFDLGRLPAGFHHTDITLHVLRRNGPGTGFDRFTYHGSHDVAVSANCDSAGPPPGPLPYVTSIQVGGLCGEPLCPYIPVPVRIAGVFPNNCFRFRRIEIVPVISNTLNPPKPPIVRVIVDDGGCLGMVCVNQPVPWQASVMLDALYPGNDPLPVQLAQVTCSDTYPPGTLYATEVPMVVRNDCGPVGTCLTPDWERGPDGGACNAIFSKLHPAELTFLVRPGTSLAGLQGEFKLDQPRPFISNIEAIGHAAGMLLQWTQTATGARFVLVAPSGAPIPPWSATVIGGGWPVLKVTVMAPVRSDAPPIPALTVLTTENLLGSDIAGNGVPVCPPPPCADLRIPPGRALICGESACDFNADGSQDIRDLVLMVHCVNAEGPCPPDAGTRFDCDGDAQFGIPDVICCAHQVLQGCPDGPCPPDTGGTRPEPRITLRFDDPVVQGQTVDLPVHITALNAIGGAMLTLQAPLDRYEVAGWSVDPPGNWLTLHQTRGGRIVLGMLDIRGGNERAALDNSVFTLRLRLRPGATPGGTVTAVGGSFSGTDGVTLEVDLGTPSQVLPGGVASTLGRNRPNPFSAETRFTLQVAEPGNAVVGIYDLRGRAVRVLHRGALPAGPREFAWDGRDADGRAVPEGVYFYQASVGGKALARKLILRRRD
jgi:hypothetical protein